MAYHRSNTISVNAFDWKPVFVYQYSKKTKLGCCLISDFAQAKVQLGVYNLRDVTSSSVVFLLMSFSGANGSL